MNVITRAVTVRLATLADVPSMVTIEEASFSDPWTEVAIASTIGLDRMRAFVAEEIGEQSLGGGGPLVVGYVLALLTGDEAEIADIAVAPNARKRGVGRALLDAVMTELTLAGVRTLFLEVRESNRAARRLYESRGFAAVGRRRGYYRLPTEDALLLRGDLVGT